MFSSMHIVPLTKENYSDWDMFCAESDDAWFWHTTDWIEYQLMYNPDRKTKNLSFFVYEEDIIKAIVPLTLETYSVSGEDVLEFSFGGTMIPATALTNDLLRVKKDRIEKDIVLEFIFCEIDRLAHLYSVMRIWIKQAPLSPRFLNEKWPSNYYIRFGYNDISLYTQLIDLRNTKEELWDKLRRNHKRNINKAVDFKATIYTSQNITEDIFSSYKETHHRAAGRKTRPDETFKAMYNWIARDIGFLVVVEYGGKMIGFEYYSIYKNNVYGFSAANDPEYAHLPVRHFLEWEAIVWMKQQNFSFYEIGLQQYGPLLYDFPDKKQLDIAHFKRGFGGFPVPFFMAEKFYNKKYLLAVYEERINKYAKALHLSDE